MSHHPIACLCSQSAQPIQLDPSADHSVLNICHCTACRETSGLLFTAYYPLAPQASHPKLDGLHEYPQSDTISRYFCRTCGAHVFAQRKDTNQYYVAAGVFAENPPTIKSIRNWQTADTRDGGLSQALLSSSSSVENDTTTGCFLNAGSTHQEDGRQNPSSPGLPAERPPPQEGVLSARCHCGGVEFHVSSPDSTSTDAWSPWPDLIVPYHEQSPENAEDVKWWLQANGTKYLAGTCTCRSCRLATGFPVQMWAFIPKSNLRNADQSPLAFNVGTMQQYNSSPRVYREFCNRCGAMVFWHCEKRPLLIDVSIGLLQANSGARAEEWLQWHMGRVSFVEMAQDQNFIRSFEVGLSDV
ncbi:hypothetical protein FE257_012078 [Aspergillus nanangensis]|uniref:CENP-V/GFA domain-containing protein n=1 Tax=Aspergillus nanangensis TaxID=2582783 RepID=A0AAD4CI10_ASPNN|nr:hypothetical protein FE257_012078 [Aspergillus nanangensis]